MRGRPLRSRNARHRFVTEKPRKTGLSVVLHRYLEAMLRRTGEQGLEPQLRHPECRVLPITPFPKGVSEDSHRSTRDRVRALLLAGMTVTEIARELGVSKPTVCFHKRRLGVRPDSRFSRRYDWAAIREFYERGHSMRQCQEKFG